MDDRIATEVCYRDAFKNIIQCGDRRSNGACEEGINSEKYVVYRDASVSKVIIGSTTSI